MKGAFLYIIILLVSIPCFSQHEFKIHENGLIYSETTMKHLKRSVDSLNLLHETCEAVRPFKSKLQTIGHRVSLNSGNIKQAKKDLDNHISLDDFTKKYPQFTIEKNVLIVKNKYEDYNAEEIVEFNQINLDGRYGFNIHQGNVNNLYEKPVKNTWVYKYQEESEYSKESLKAFYFPREFKSILLDKKYSDKIAYSECLIDTLACKQIEASDSERLYLPNNWTKLSKTEQEKLLNQMRSTRVVGYCSMDQSPRIHAMNIALLSAETNNWEIFLESHLDIMNDRFDRMSDSSYAKESRKTYIREIEELNINVNDLLIGIAMRIENSSSNHYYGNIGRLGRAMAESKYRESFENELISMIEDNELDDFNRVLSYFLFLDLNHFLEDKNTQKRNLKILQNSIERMPYYLFSRMNPKD